MGFGMNEIARSKPTLDELLKSSSRTFALVIPKLPEPLRTQVGTAYLVARIIDEVEDNPRIEPEKKEMMLLVPEAINEGGAKIAQIKEFFSRVEPTKPEYRTLLDNPNVVHNTMKNFPETIRETIVRHCYNMAFGLSHPELGKINSIEEHHEYCHFAAGLVGYMVSELTHLSGLITQDTLSKMMPSPEIRRRGVNSAHDFGVGLQLVNDIRDIFEDNEAGAPKWPRDLLDRREINFEQIVSLKRGDEQTKVAYEILREQIEDARKYLDGGVKWVEFLPYEPSGMRECWGSALAFAAATCRKINTERFFYDVIYRKIKRAEIKTIQEKIEELTKQRKSVGEFVEHLFEKSAGEYSS